MPNIRQLLNLAAAKAAIKVSPSPLSLLTDALARREPTSLIRFGDGEWAAILGHSGANCDGHNYSDDLGRALLHTLKAPVKAHYGMQPYALKCMGAAIARCIKKEKLTVPWINADILHDANKDGRLNPFVKVLRERECVIIGPSYLDKIRNSLFTPIHHITIPQKNCFEARREIVSEIRSFGKNRDTIVYLFSASMAANVIIHDLFDEFGSRNSLLDVGSLWDIYCGVKSRGVYEELNWQELIKANILE